MKKAIKKLKGTTPAALIQAAVAGGADLDKLEKLLDLQLRWEANEAKKAYVLAMAAFQRKPPLIEKDKHVKFQTAKGIVEYDHATLANVTKKINGALSKHGLSAGWRTNQDEKGISVTCKITHVMGHSEETTLKSASDLTGGKNAIQAIGSAVSYLQRYTLLSLTGLATFDMDDDGKSTEPPTGKATKPPTKKDPKQEKYAIQLANLKSDIHKKILVSPLLSDFEKWMIKTEIEQYTLDICKKCLERYSDTNDDMKNRLTFHKQDKQNGTDALGKYLVGTDNRLKESHELCWESYQKDLKEKQNGGKDAAS